MYELALGARKKLSKAAMQRAWDNPETKAKQSPSAKDIAWVAGLYEGEGTTRFTKSSCVHHGKRLPNGRLDVRLAQKERQILDWTQQKFGGRIHKRVNQVNGKPDRTYYSWGVTGSRAAGFLMTIFPFLSDRRKAQALKALHDWRSWEPRELAYEK